MSLIDFNVDFNLKALGSIIKSCFDIPKWLKTIVVLTFIAAIVYFGVGQGYLYNDQMKELSLVQQELIDTRDRIQHSVLNIDEYNKDFTLIIKEFILVKEMNDHLLNMHDEQLSLILEFLKLQYPSSRDLYYLDKQLARNREFFRRNCIANLKRSLFHVNQKAKEIKKGVENERIQIEGK